jgi:hypothetical protein
MPYYIEFPAEDGSNILVEVDEQEVSPDAGLVKAGVKEKVKETLAIAQTTFEEAVERAVRRNAQAMLQAVKSLPEPPTEVEITFGLKATGEIGNAAVAKSSGEGNYTIKLAWKREKG